METISSEGLPRMAICEPADIQVEAGKVYKWCSCGLTAIEPFCDNTHRDIEGTPFRSIKVRFDKPQVVSFCQCKRTKTPPFCDDSHKALKL
jgi:CDGSH-type Zn-finger protein